MFDFTGMGTVLGVWFLAYRDKDLMAVAWQATAISHPQARYRIRYYAPGSSADGWDDMDEKSWFDIEAQATGAEMVANLRAWIALLRERWHEPSTLTDEFLGPATPVEVFSWLKTRPWAHGRAIGPGDPDWARYHARRDA